MGEHKRTHSTACSHLYAPPWMSLHPCARPQVALVSLQCIPRSTRAQVYDVLGSMATLAGYRAVVEAAQTVTYLYLHIQLQALP